jgi:2-polyprenyl-3-methyl-5-hydroxy-6-metoxy-1,4-benzoquinol methylase
MREGMKDIQLRSSKKSLYKKSLYKVITSLQKYKKKKVALECNPTKKQVQSYQGKRPDIVAHIHKATSILDLGCNEGAVSSELCLKFPQVEIVGIDVNPEALAVARTICNETHCIDINNVALLEAVLSNKAFDVIVAGDVLEHIQNPWGVVQVLIKYLKDDGILIASVPNVGHWGIFFHLIMHFWPLRERGIFDSTHLRFFMYHNIATLAPKGTTSTIIQRKFRLFEGISIAKLDKLVQMSLGRLPWLREFFVFQYIFIIKHQK